MNKRCFQVDALGIDAMHAEPIAALGALALHSTHSPRYEFPSRAARDDLDSAHHSRSL
jgi:hypothetical protein